MGETQRVEFEKGPKGARKALYVYHPSPSDLLRDCFTLFSKLNRLGPNGQSEISDQQYWILSLASFSQIWSQIGSSQPLGHIGGKSSQTLITRTVIQIDDSMRS